ncbi:MAG TPA: hypothetical protein VJR58_23565 [Vineibacter sp.]|nr:hypothetical protein [Vineibacter sp.]
MVFLFLGPPIGATCLMVGAALTVDRFADSIFDLILMTGAAALMSYAYFGGVAAGIAGIISGVYCAWKRALPLWVASLSGVVAGVVSLIRRGTTTSYADEFGLALIGISLCASMACWWILRRFRFV